MRIGKMCAICPKCKEVIDYLCYVTTESSGGSFCLEKGVPQYEEDYRDENGDSLIFKCPECEEELFNLRAYAIKFLRDKDELAELVAEKVKYG